MYLAYEVYDEGLSENLKTCRNPIEKSNLKFLALKIAIYGFIVEAFKEADFELTIDRVEALCEEVISSFKSKVIML